MDLYQVLDDLKIEYKQVEHPPVFSAEESQKIKMKIQGVGGKNLFLTDKKGGYYLVILPDEKKANLKEIAKSIGTSHLTFADEKELKEILGVTRGSVTPLGIINDIENKVLVLLDKDLQHQTLLAHPNRNTATISIKFEDLIRFIEYEKHKYFLI